MMTYIELKRLVQALIDEHGAEEFLLAVAVGLEGTHREASDMVNKARLDLLI